MNGLSFQRAIAWSMFLTALAPMLVSVARDGLSDRAISGDSFLAIMAFTVLGGLLISTSRYTV